MIPVRRARDMRRARGGRTARAEGRGELGRGGAREGVRAGSGDLELLELEDVAGWGERGVRRKGRRRDGARTRM